MISEKDQMSPVTTRTTYRVLASSTLLAVVLAAHPATSFAQSSVTLYGGVDDAITYVNNQNGHSNVYLRQGSIYSSKFGFRIAEDLGGGTRAIVDLQAGFDVNTGAFQSSGVLFNRNAFFGVDNVHFGTLTLGRQYTPYYLFVGPLTASVWLSGATSARPGDVDGLDTTIRANNSVTYTSPSISGLQVSGLYAFGGTPGSLHPGSTYSAAVRYTPGNLSLAAGYLRMNNTGNTSSFDPNASGSLQTSVVNQGYVSARAIDYYALAANYRLGDYVIGANYSHVAYSPGQQSAFSDRAIFNSYGALVSYRITPALSVGAAISHTQATSANGISDPAAYMQYSMKEQYYLSKRTFIYALQGYQHSSGKTLGAAGANDIIQAGASVGDSQGLTPSSTHEQFMAVFGLGMMF